MYFWSLFCIANFMIIDHIKAHQQIRNILHSFRKYRCYWPHIKSKTWWALCWRFPEVLPLSLTCLDWKFTLFKNLYLGLCHFKFQRKSQYFAFPCTHFLPLWKHNRGERNAKVVLFPANIPVLVWKPWPGKRAEGKDMEDPATMSPSTHHLKWLT